MKKKVLPLLLCIVMMLNVNAHASGLRMVRVVPQLNFRGTTAYCEVSISDAGKINAVLELWNGTTVVKSWSGEGDDGLFLSGSCSVKSGVTYTLKVSGTIAGTAFTGSPVTGKC